MLTCYNNRILTSPKEDYEKVLKEMLSYVELFRSKIEQE